MIHEKPIDSTREAEKPASAQTETTAQVPEDVPQPALDQILEDLPEPTDEAALYHLLSVC